MAHISFILVKITSFSFRSYTKIALLVHLYVRSFVRSRGKTWLNDACTFSRTLRSRSFLHPMGAIGIFFIREKIVGDYL